MTIVKVRAADLGDTEALLNAFSRSGSAEATGLLWGDSRAEAEIYLLPYIDHEHAVVLVAIDHNQVLGYLAGCFDTARFPSESERFDSAIRASKVLRSPAALRFFTRALWDTTSDKVHRRNSGTEFRDPRWPAHFHISVIPEAQGRGVADVLVTSWLSSLRSAGHLGCHVQPLAENTRAVNFFLKHGFAPHIQAAVPGVRLQGRRVRQLTMVTEAGDHDVSGSDNSTLSRWDP